MNDLTTYKDFVRSNLPTGMTVVDEYYFVNSKRFTNYIQAEWYLNYIKKFGFATVTDPYVINGFTPPLVLDFASEFYRVDGSSSTFADAVTFSRSGNATMVDSDGLLKWAPHNLLTYSEEFTGYTLIRASLPSTITGPFAGTTAKVLVESTAVAATHLMRIPTVSIVLGETYRITVWLKAQGRNAGEININAAPGIICDYDLGSVTVSTGTITSAGDGWYKVSFEFTPTGASSLYRQINMTETYQGPTSYTGDGTSGVAIWGWHMHRNDLGGMTNNPDQTTAGLESYVPTTSAARYLARRGNHVYNGTSWVNEGLQIESESGVQLLHTTNALVTQSYTTTAVPHTLHFTGTGTVTLSGASTAGPLVGTGTGEENRVSLTFTPTASSLILTVSGTVTDAQLEVGSTPSSYIPNLAASGIVTRAAETATVAAANMPTYTTAVSIQTDGTMTGASSALATWQADANNNILISTGASDFSFTQESASVVDTVTGGSYTAGINVPCNIASRHGSTFINGAVDGTALTANTTPTSLPDLSATDFQIGPTFNGNIGKLVVWSDDIGDVGIAEASA